MQFNYIQNSMVQNFIILNKRGNAKHNVSQIYMDFLDTVSIKKTHMLLNQTCRNSDVRHTILLEL